LKIKFWIHYFTGGPSTGLEIWNINTGAVKLVVDKMPLEIITSLPVGGTSLIPINDNTELILMGGWGGAFYGLEVYKYNYPKNIFKYLGNLQMGIQFPLLIPVVGIECP